ncbi:MAG: MSCRAMM family protein [Candidatus Xenobia bacterium]
MSLRAVWAQGQAPIPGAVPAPPFLYPASFFLTQDAAETLYENGWGNDLLFLDNRLSLLDPALRVDAPLLLFSSPTLQAVGGNQLLSGATPFLDLFEMQGLRLGWRDGPWSGSLWGGQTDNLDDLIQNGSTIRQDLFGGTLGWHPSSAVAAGLSWMPYASQNGGAVDRSLTMGQLFLSNQETWSANLAYGEDLGTAVPGEVSGDRQALRADVSANLGKFSMSADIFNMGSLFGPAQGITDLRGTDTSDALATYAFTPRVSFVEQYRFDQAGFPGLVDTQVTASSDMLHHLLMHGRTWQLDVGQEDTTNAATGAFAQTVHQYFALGNLKRKLKLWSGELRYLELAPGINEDLMRGRLDTPLAHGLTGSLQETLTRIASGAIQASTLDSTLTLDKRLADDQGYVSLLLDVLQNQQGALSSSAVTSTVSVGWHWQGPFWFTGSFTDASAGTLAQTGADVSLRWITDPHSELVLSEHYHQGGILVDVAGIPTLLGNRTQLTWTTALHGPDAQRLAHDLEGRIVVTVTTRPPGAPARLEQPVAHVPLTIGDQSVETNQAGQAVLKGLAPGRYTVSLKPRSLGRNYTLEGAATREVTVRPAGITRTTFRSTAYASVYVVAYNDTDGIGKLTTPYTPLPAIAVSLNGQNVRATNAEGSVTYKELQPGSYQVAIQPGSLVAGLTPTTPTSTSITLQPGQEAVVTFGLQGYGRLVGTARVTPPGEAAPTQPLANATLTADGRPIGKTTADGHIDVKIPAGTHVLSIDPGLLGTRRYLVGGAPRLVVSPAATVSRDLVVASFATVEVQLVHPDGTPWQLSGLVVTMSGVPRFQYSDDSGHVVFESLPMGPRLVTLDPASVPSDLRLVGASQQKLSLLSGAHPVVRFVLKKR